MKPTNLLAGLIGVIGIWLTAGLALPLVNILSNFSPQQLMMARGAVTALLAGILAGKKINYWDHYTMTLGLFFSLTCLGLYNGVRTWGACPTILIMSCTPLVSLFFIYWRGHSIARSVYLGLSLVLLGVTITLQPWNHLDTELNWRGLAWSLLGVSMNAYFYESLTKTQAPRMCRCFWQAIAVLIVGCLGPQNYNWQILLTDPKTAGLLLGFAIIGGFLYFIANIETFKNLPIEVASILAQGETLAVIVMANFILAETLSPGQWLGVSVAISGNLYLTRWLTKQRVD